MARHKTEIVQVYESKMSQKKAYFIKYLQPGPGGGVRGLFKMEPPFRMLDEQERSEPFDHVCASATNVEGKPETQLFASDENGQTLGDFVDQNATIIPEMNIWKIISLFGYEVVMLDKQER